MDMDMRTVMERVLGVHAHLLDVELREVAQLPEWHDRERLLNLRAELLHAEVDEGGARRPERDQYR